MNALHPNEPQLYALLDQLGIAHQTEEHEAVFTVEESRDIKARLPGGHSKNLFLKDKAGQFVLISALADTPIKLNRLHAHLGMKRLSFGREEALFDHLGVRPGSVTVFSVMNDTNAQVRLVLDAALFEQEFVWFHPLRNTASTRVRADDLIAFAKATEHDPLILDLAGLAAGD
ncbi:DNA-binding protein [Algimonas ampicilliniresistens]|jgi:Ala-tRNA(Pro) deacylase|uniref:DNA-binding protein n=1 Tax=Algimonas ampicilliniresistens TaxID=1298735 RepID=A0ABQ5V8R4_9PROT|nr:prolyl-tRNA synthetase associated domain-containing protein [Algimonas ampicilliniresistens]GLQ23805.1 DNA-binding protein [Algimonas ampicilliniresistens]